MSPPATPGVLLSPSSTGTPNATFVSPLAGYDEDLDANHDEDTPLRFRAVDDIIDNESPPRYIVRHLGARKILVVSAEEPTSLADAQRNHVGAWQWRSCSPSSITTPGHSVISRMTGG